jgi:Zn-dependent protease
MQLDILQKISVWALPVIFAITVHEAAHGFVASKFGDQTAKMMGRLTLNPLKHIDWVGTVIVPLLLLIYGSVLFGWAKPVPISPRNFKHPRPQMAIVAAAGPISNLLMAILWAIIGKLGMIAMMHGTMAFRAVFLMGQAGIYINVIIGVLNLIPLPPLDGGRIISNIIPPKTAYYYDKLEPFGFLILLILLVTGVLWFAIGPIVMGLTHALFSIFGLGF